MRRSLTFQTKGQGVSSESQWKRLRQQGQLKSFQSIFLASPVFSLPIQDFMYFIFQTIYTLTNRALISKTNQKQKTKQLYFLVIRVQISVFYLVLKLLIQICKMGQSSSTYIPDSQLLQRLTFILEEEMPHLGQIKVYRLIQRPYDHYFRYRQVFPDDSEHHNKAAQAQQFYSKLEGYRNIVKVECIKIERQKDLCSTSILMDSYARYHNYTIEDGIKCKRKNTKMFRDCDLLYIFNCLVEVGNKVSALTGNTYLGMFQSHRLFFSTEGFLKVYPFKLLPHPINDEHHSHQTEKEDCYHTHQTDLKDLGFLMAQLCLLESKQDLCRLSKEHTNFRLQQTLAGRISFGIRKLIVRLLEGEELSWPMLKNELQDIHLEEGVKPAYCIRLEEDISMRQSEIMNRQNQELVNMKASRQMMLSSVHANLKADPITPLSNSKQKHLTQTF